MTKNDKVTSNQVTLNAILNVVNDSNATAQDLSNAITQWDSIKGEVTSSIKPFVACLLSDAVAMQCEQ